MCVFGYILTCRTFNERLNAVILDAKKTMTTFLLAEKMINADIIEVKDEEGLFFVC